MTRDKIPIDETHAAQVEAQLARLKATGPAPRKTWTRQALVERMAATVTSLRAAGFSLDEIADAMSYNGVKYSPEVLSSYLSRLKHAGNGVASKTQPKKASRKPLPTLAAATNRTTSPPPDTTRDFDKGDNNVVSLVAPEMPSADIQVDNDPALAETNDQDPAPPKSVGAATPKIGKAWLTAAADRRASG